MAKQGGNVRTAMEREAHFLDTGQVPNSASVIKKKPTPSHATTNSAKILRQHGAGEFKLYSEPTVDGSRKG
jgi:hypothetical protein